MNIHKLTVTASCFAALTLAHGVLADPPKTATPAPSITGSLEGDIRDVHGEPIPFAVVLIVSTGETTRADQMGRFSFTGEEAGAYIIEVIAPSYKTISLGAVVNQGILSRLDFVLVSYPTKARKIVPSVKPGKAVAGSNLHQDRRVPAEPFANEPLNSFPGDVGLHSTARSR